MREAGGAALQNLMADLVWRTTPIGRTVFEAVAGAAKCHGVGRTAVEDPLSGKLSYRRLLAGADVLGRTKDGRLMLYTGNGRGGWKGTRQVGNGWQGMTALVAPGDWNGDGRADVLGRRAFDLFPFLLETGEERAEQAAAETAYGEIRAEVGGTARQDA